MAFRRSTAAFATHKPGPEVHPALVKFWSKYSSVDGEVTRHLSPNQIRIMMPLYEAAPAKMARKMKNFGPYVVGTFLMVYGTIKYTVYIDDMLAREHRLSVVMGELPVS
ncbi:hypothetical protein JKP88DRAFT_285871 [Tribonema minus]|uniref:Uncharacterized protein n=1 Tax=Tribonema minus TaxID=303371 RepID=A0A835ZEE9_9STRA|nr:hypothetical protein JKP88DRAFT_285871 [Tribonema minus]